MIKRVANAASIVVRHAGAYGDLIADDVRSYNDALGRRLWAGVILATAVAFSVAMACVWAIAFMWDTAGRLWLIGGLFGIFVLISVAAFLVLRTLKSHQQGLLPRTGLEWSKDRVLLDDLLSVARRGSA